MKCDRDRNDRCIPYPVSFGEHLRTQSTRNNFPCPAPDIAKHYFSVDNIVKTPKKGEHNELPHSKLWGIRFRVQALVALPDADI